MTLFSVVDSQKLILKQSAGSRCEMWQGCSCCCLKMLCTTLLQSPTSPATLQTLVVRLLSIFGFLMMDSASYKPSLLASWTKNASCSQPNHQFLLKQPKYDIEPQDFVGIDDCINAENNHSICIYRYTKLILPLILWVP